MPEIGEIKDLENFQDLTQDQADKKVQNNEFQNEINTMLSNNKAWFDANTAMLELGRKGVETTAKMTTGSFSNSTQTLARGYER